MAHDVTPTGEKIPKEDEEKMQEIAKAMGELAQAIHALADKGIRVEFHGFPTAAPKVVAEAVIAEQEETPEPAQEPTPEPEAEKPAPKKRRKKKEPEPAVEEEEATPETPEEEEATPETPEEEEATPELTKEVIKDLLMRVRETHQNDELLAQVFQRTGVQNLRHLEPQDFATCYKWAKKALETGEV